MSLIKLSLDRNNLIIRAHGELVSDIPAADGKTVNLFYSVGPVFYIPLFSFLFLMALARE
jgi:hypothetical protein